MKAGRPKEKGGWALTKRKVREQNPGLTGTQFYRAVMSMYSGKGKMKKSYGERMFSEFGGEHKFPLEEKGYGLTHISEHHKGGKSITRHTFVHPQTGHVARVTHVHDPATGEKTASWRHFERGSHGLTETGRGVSGEHFEAHLNRIHRESLQAKSLVLKAMDRARLRELGETEEMHTRFGMNAGGALRRHGYKPGKSKDADLYDPHEGMHDYQEYNRKGGHKVILRFYHEPSGASWEYKGPHGNSGERHDLHPLHEKLRAAHGEPGPEKSIGGTMDINKAGEGRTMEWIAALFGYAEDRPNEDMGTAAGLGKGPTGEWVRPDGWGMSLTARPNMQQFNLHGPDGALYQGLGKHELFTTLRKIHHGPWFTQNRPDMTPVGPMNAVQRSLAEIGESLEDEGIWLFKAKKGSKTVRPLSDAKKQQRQLAFRQYGSALRLKKPRLPQPPEPGEKIRHKSLRAGGPVSKSACTACGQSGAIFVVWRGPEGLQKGYRICPVCQNDGQPLAVEKGLKSAVGGALNVAGKKVAQFGSRLMGGRTKMPMPKSSPNASAKGLTVHLYGGTKGGQHQYGRVYPKSKADYHAVAERERKGNHVIGVDGPPHLVKDFNDERNFHHSSGGAKLCPGCKYHAAVGALKGSSSPQQATA